MTSQEAVFKLVNDLGQGYAIRIHASNDQQFVG